MNWYDFCLMTIVLYNKTKDQSMFQLVQLKDITFTPFTTSKLTHCFSSVCNITNTNLESGVSWAIFLTYVGF